MLFLKKIDCLKENGEFKKDLRKMETFLREVNKLYQYFSGRRICGRSLFYERGSSTCSQRYISYEVHTYLKHEYIHQLPMRFLISQCAQGHQR